MWTTKQALEKKKKKETHLQEWVMSMQCIHGYTVCEKRMYVCLYWLWSTDYVQMCEILWNKYSFIHSVVQEELNTVYKVLCFPIGVTEYKFLVTRRQRYQYIKNIGCQPTS